jgi:L-ribulose-5-phosphate 4-epimerase
MLRELKEEVWLANLDLVKHGLVILTWGNVSGIDRRQGIFVIKPSGVPYSDLRAKDMVAVDLDGKVVDGTLNPSSDTPTHRILYMEIATIGGITHAHSPHATGFAQARMPIPCFGTTHADAFHGEVPITRMLTQKEVDEGYEINTGRLIAARFRKLNPVHVPGVLVAGHGPFTWGKNAADSVANSAMLEQIAGMALSTLQLKSGASPLPAHILEKHFQRKHGRNAYYGQKR